MTEIFTFLPLERVLYGPGSIAGLSSEVERLGCSRILIITGHTVAHKTPLVERIVELLGRRHAGTFAEIRQHVPQSDVERAAGLALDNQADLLLSVGGGSAIDAAKAVAWAMRGDDRPGLPAPPPHIAVPTTLSAAEFSHIAGFTVEGDENSKERVVDAALTPRVVILDAEMTVETPAWLWASSGIRALDHAVETLYAPGDHPIQSLLALEAIRELFACLPQSSAQPDNVALRQRCQLAAWMSYFAPGAIEMGLSHRLSKSFGTTYNVPHGITSGITLPAVMRHVAAAHREPLARMARALQVVGPDVPASDAALAAAAAVADLVRRLDLPGRLRDVNVPREAIPAIARAAGGNADQQAASIRILQEAW